MLKHSLFNILGMFSVFTIAASCANKYFLMLLYCINLLVCSVCHYSYSFTYLLYLSQYIILHCIHACTVYVEVYVRRENMCFRVWRLTTTLPIVKIAVPLLIKYKSTIFMFFLQQLKFPYLNPYLTAERQSKRSVVSTCIAILYTLHI